MTGGVAAADRGFVVQMAMDVERGMATADDAGLDYVEILLDGPDDRIDSEAVRAGLDRHDLDLVVHLPTADIDLATPHEHVRDGSVRETQAAIDEAADMGAGKVVAHAKTNAWPVAWDREDVIDPLCESIRRVDEYAAERGVTVCYENLAGDLLDVDAFPTIFERTDAAMTLDTGHAYLGGFDTAAQAEFLAEHGDRVSHFHLNDTRRESDEHLPFGAGFLGFERLFDALPEDWDGTLSLEVFTHDHGYVETSAERLDALLSE